MGLGAKGAKINPRDLTENVLSQGKLFCFFRKDWSTQWRQKTYALYHQNGTNLSSLCERLKTTPVYGFTRTDYTVWNYRATTNHFKKKKRRQRKLSLQLCSPLSEAFIPLPSPVMTPICFAVRFGSTKKWQTDVGKPDTVEQTLRLSDDFNVSQHLKEKAFHLDSHSINV